MEKKSTKPVRARILLTLLILILAIIFGVIFVYRDNIKALWRGLTTDTGEIGEMIQETQKQTKNALSDAGMNVSEDDFNKLNNGDLSQEEIEAIIYDSLTDASNGTADPDSGSETPADDEKGDNADSADGKTTGSTDTSSKDPASGTGKDSSQASGGQTCMRPAKRQAPEIIPPAARIRPAARPPVRRRQKIRPLQRRKARFRLRRK